MPIPVIAAGIGAAANLFGAKKASDSVKNAAKTQSAAADKALALNEQAWQQQQQLQAPYQQAGRSAVNNLSALMTPGQPYTPAMQAQRPMPMMPPQGAPQGPPQGMPGPRPMGPPNPMAQAMGGGMVPMIGPDGSRTMVPRQMVQQALGMGGRMAQ